jgi:hypothetical protein
MDKLSELCRAKVTGIWLLTRMQSQMSFEVGSAAKTLVTNVALVWLFTYNRVQL